MKTKIIPFDLETAKKIQAGEIKGRIVTNHGEVVTLVDAAYGFNEEYWIPIIWHWATEDNQLVLYNSKGECRNSHSNCYLHIELPEEEPKHDSFSKKLHDTAEVLATPIHEFKAGDKVKIHCEGDQYDNKIGEVVDVLTNVLHVRVKALPFTYKINEVEFIAHGRVDNSVNSESSKHKFKSFDKVLVRNKSNERWHPNFYATTDGLLYYTIDCKSWCQCIPYEGNQELVGTTDKPEED